MARYFYTTLGLRPIIVDGREYKPDLVSGQRDGVLVAETDQQAADLASQLGRGLTEIPLAEFEQLMAQKKTTHTSGHLSNSSPVPRAVAQQPSRLPVTLEPKQGVAYAANDPKPEPKPEEEKSEVSIEDIKEVGKVASPQPVAEKERVGGQAKRKRGAT